MQSQVSANLINQYLESLEKIKITQDILISNLKPKASSSAKDLEELSKKKGKSIDSAKKSERESNMESNKKLIWMLSPKSLQKVQPLFQEA